jgi:hypothetical protein
VLSTPLASDSGGVKTLAGRIDVGCTYAPGSDAFCDLVTLVV